HALFAELRAQGVGHLAVRIRAVPIGTPLPDVAVHVKEAPGVGRERTDGRRRLAINALLPPVIGPVAVIVGLVGRDGRAGAERRGGAGAAGILPFGLGRQAVDDALEPGQFVAELLTILPADILDG